MRILQLIFSIWGFFACRDFSITLDMDCNDKSFQRRYEIEYPFEFNERICLRKSDNQTMFVSVDSSSGAQFFVVTAVLSLLYALFIVFVYAYLDEMYKSKPEFPMAVSCLLSAPTCSFRLSATRFRILRWRESWRSSGWLEPLLSAAAEALWRRRSMKTTSLRNVLSVFLTRAVSLTWVLLW